MWNNIHVKYVSKLVCSKINSCTGRFYTPDSRQYATSSLGYSDYAPYQIMKKKEVVIWIRTNKNSIPAQYIRSSDRKGDKRRQLEVIEKKICEMAPGMSNNILPGVFKP